MGSALGFHAIPLFQRAIQLDPNLAVAQAGLAASYANLGEHTLAAENIRKAYELREPVSEMEKIRIVVLMTRVGLARAPWRRHVRLMNPGHRLIQETGQSAWNSLGITYHRALGQYDKMLPAILEAARLSPTTPTIRSGGNLAFSISFLNRPA